MLNDIIKKKTIIGKKPNMERNNWLIDEKILISFKLICIWMKILNEIACTLNWISIKFKFNLIVFKFNCN
jgi:hypothetical protein